MTATEIDLLKTASDWAKAEMISSAFFAIFGLLFVLTSLCFWHYGKTVSAKAFIIPLLVVGVLLLILGIGLVISTQMRLSAFADALNSDSAAFIATEIAYIDKTMMGYQNAIFKILPLCLIASALLMLFVKSPLWHASLITAMAMFVIIMLIDTNAHARLADYKEKLQQADHIS